MNTANIKSFAQKARLLLMEGVAARLIYWGFDENGNATQNLQETTGGYTFRGGVFTDTAVPEKWKMLKARLKDSQAVKDVIEEAAYTWFNRLMALKILEKNGYLAPQLQYVEKLRVPEILQRAKRGDHQLNALMYKELLREYLQEDKEEDALGLLLTRFSNNNPLLHEVFGRIDDYTEILLPQNLLQPDGILDLINSDFIEIDDYKEVELIGWLYQFYISDKKDEVFKGFKKNKKARAEDIPAATQIFTPKWIVKYMVENTLGKTYLDLEPNSSLKEEMKYLVENGTETSAEPIVDDVEELSLLDPASGSGHILVTGFELLFKMYREAGYNAKRATISILENNLYGLDIDERAMQLARFAVLLKAAKEYPEILQPIGPNQKIQLPHIYAFPEAADFSNEELQSFLGEEGEHLADLKEVIQLLKQGKNIGAALKFELPEAARKAIVLRYEYWKTREDNLDFNEQLIWNKLKSCIEVLLVMTMQYTAVVANPPYMGQKSMNADLKNYVNKNYPATKSDLMTVFMEVIPNFTSDNSMFALINLPSWLFLSTFQKLREYYIDNFSFDSLLHMGRGIFGIDFGSVALAVKKSKNDDTTGSYFRLHERNFQHIRYEDIEKLFLFSNGKENYKYDFGQYRGEDGITEIPVNGTETGLKLFYPNIPQTNFEKIPGSPIAYWVSEKEQNFYDSGKFFANHSYPRKGIDTGQNAYFLRFWYEVDRQKSALNNYNPARKWFPYNKGGEFRKWYGNRENLVNWENKGEEIKSRLDWKSKKPTIRNFDFHFREGFTWSTISSSGFSCRYTPDGALFDNGGCTLFSDKELHYLGGMLNTKIAKRYFEFLSPTLNFQPGDIGKMLYISPNGDEDKVESVVNDSIVISKQDWDSRETSWDFKQSPLLKTRAGSLKESFTQWLAAAKEDFVQLHQNEEELNRIFIEIYGLQDELTPEVPLKDITILQKELNRKSLEKLEPQFRANGKETIALPIEEAEVISQFISYLIGVMMGRYRLDKFGLNIAHPNPTEEELASYTVTASDGETLTINIDRDAILPLMGEDCAFPDDVLVQLKKLLQAIWGEDSLTANINFLQQSLGTSLHTWLTTKLWKYHTGMYKKKPIYWLFSSNPKKPEKSAFKVLAYMHRMDKFTVQQIQRNYLYPHQDHIKAQLQSLKENEANLSKDEQKELEKLQSWELELRDYNEVLKDLANQQIEFDLDDGVSVNYEKFEGAVAMI